MLRIFIAALLVLAGHFALSVYNPGPKATIIWPWGENSQAIIAGLGGLPKHGGLVSMLLGTGATLAFVAAFLSLFGWFVPATWFQPLVIIGSAASFVLFALFFSPIALVPMAVNAVLLIGVLSLHWTPATVQ